MSKESFAIINDQDQVVNHILVDKDAPDFEQVMADQLAHWGCVRYVETTEEQPVIILDESPEIWTTHTEETGFVLPDGFVGNQEVVTPREPLEHEVRVAGRILPKDSLLFIENAALRPEGWSLPEGIVELSLNDAE